MTQEQFLRLITYVADTSGYPGTIIYDYLWSILRHPIAPASINRFLNGSKTPLDGKDFNDEYADRLRQIVQEQGIAPG